MLLHGSNPLIFLPNLSIAINFATSVTPSWVGPLIQSWHTSGVVRVPRTSLQVPQKLLFPFYTHDLLYFKFAPSYQKSTMWLVHKEKVSTPPGSSSTILPLPKFTNVRAPNLVPSRPDHLGWLDLSISCPINLLYELPHAVQDVPRPLIAGNVLDPTLFFLNIKSCLLIMLALSLFESL